MSKFKLERTTTELIMVGEEPLVTKLLTDRDITTGGRSARHWRYFDYIPQIIPVVFKQPKFLEKGLL